MTLIEQIQEWYASQCDGDWEHSYGVEIGTLDNPGWLIKIDLIDTKLQDREFAQMSRGDSDIDVDWLHAKIEEGKFQGACGAKNLEELLGIFLKWADA